MRASDLTGVRLYEGTLIAMPLKKGSNSPTNEFRIVVKSTDDGLVRVRGIGDITQASKEATLKFPARSVFVEGNWFEYEQSILTTARRIIEPMHMDALSGVREALAAVMKENEWVPEVLEPAARVVCKTVAAAVWNTAYQQSRTQSPFVSKHA